MVTLYKARLFRAPPTEREILALTPTLAADAYAAKHLAWERPSVAFLEVLVDEAWKVYYASGDPIEIVLPRGALHVMRSIVTYETTEGHAVDMLREAAVSGEGRAKRRRTK